MRQTGSRPGSEGSTAPRTVNRNIEIQDLDSDVDLTLNVLAAISGVTKKEIIRRALTAYVETHRGDITAYQARKVVKHG